MQKEIIKPIERDIIEKELNPQTFQRKSNNGNNEIYIINHRNSPNTMMEIARLREVSFRMSGGGTGNSFDIDDYDTDPNGFQQLLVWDPAEKEIVGGYRFILGRNAGFYPDGTPKLATSGLLNYSSKFINEILPYTIELGRSFVQPAYQPSKDSRKGLFSLDNLWDGLGSLIIDYPESKYFFGKVTMYKHFNPVARDLILYFMNTFFPDKDNLIIPKAPLGYKTDVTEFESLFTGTTLEENHKILLNTVRKYGENVPPLFNSYLSLSPTMKTCGTAWNEEFGGVEETAILVTIADIYDPKIDRHVSTYKK